MNKIVDRGVRGIADVFLLIDYIHQSNKIIGEKTELILFTPVHNLGRFENRRVYSENSNGTIKKKKKVL